MSRPGLLLGAALALCAAAPGAAPPPPSAEDRFEALLREIGALRDDLAALDRRERGLLNEVDRLEVRAALSARELEKLGAQKERTAHELDETSRLLEARRRAVAQEEASLARQLRAAYEMGRSRELRLLLSLRERVDVMRAIAYLDAMARRQSVVVASLRRGRADMEALEGALKAQAEGLADLAARERAKAAELEEVRARSSELLEATRRERDAHREAIAELGRAAEALEKAIVSEAGGNGSSPGPPAVDVVKLRGALEWPVPGEIALPFGDIRHRRFGTVTPHPGVEIRTEPREPIRAILGGRVVFARRFSGYGNTVLVDHGGGYLSVYARAAILNVVEGEEVLPGHVLGRSADQAFDNGPPTVYFELRHAGRAVDPAGWLKRRPAARREGDR